MTAFAAVDLGASSGRVVVGTVADQRAQLHTVARFPNGPVRRPDGLHWDLDALTMAVDDGLHTAAARTELAGVAVDSWAVDYGLLRDDHLLGEPFHYRDERCTRGVDRVHAVAGRGELYERTGLQFLPFNTLYQLAADPLVDGADHALLIPDLIGFGLTGVAVTERTNASTTGLLGVTSREWDRELFARLDLAPTLFAPLVDPGETIGKVRELDVPLVAVGSHDTASAVVGAPLTDEAAAYISCGTWGLVGLELDRPICTSAAREANFTNEGGVDGRVRFLTNVMGTWLLTECLRAWGEPDIEALLAAAAAVPAPPTTIDVQDPRFVAAGEMPARIAAWCREHDRPVPADRPSLVRCIVESLAQAYADALERAGTLAGRSVRTVHIVGGGSQNSLLCQSVADRSGRPVVAGPVEATALGNVLVQARAAGAVRGALEDLRSVVARSVDLRRYPPRTSGAHR